MKRTRNEWVTIAFLILGISGLAKFTYREACPWWHGGVIGLIVGRVFEIGKWFGSQKR